MQEQTSWVASATTIEKWNQLEVDRQKELIYQQTDIDKEHLYMCAKNANVFTAFVEEAIKVRRAGHNHYSARTIIEVLRHHSAIKDKDCLFKINNNLTKPFAVLSMQIFPELNNFFEVRNKS